MNKRILMGLILMIACITFTGCWNYKEIEDLAIVAGAAIDKNEDGTIHLTTEIADVTSDGQVSYKPVLLEIDGDTFYDCVRRGSTMEGKRLYWSHAKVVIISQEIAKEDVIQYLDFLFRDSEARADIWLLVSREKTAKEILESKGKGMPIISFQIDSTMRAHQTLSRFPFIELYEFFDRIFFKNVSPVLPAVHLVSKQGEKVAQVEGTAIFKDNKLIGFFEVEDTKSMLWLRDEVYGGLIILKNIAGTKDDIALDIFKSKTKFSPYVQDGKLKMKVKIELETGIAEQLGTTDFYNSAALAKLSKAAEKEIENQIKATYKLTQEKYNADIFGFGRRIDIKLPYVWNEIKNDWDKTFADLELEVDVKLDIRGTAITKTPLKVGE